MSSNGIYYMPLKARTTFQLSDDVTINNLKEINEQDGIKFIKNDFIDLNSVSKIFSDGQILRNLTKLVKTGNESIKDVYQAIEQEFNKSTNPNVINGMQLTIVADNSYQAIELAKEKAKLVCNVLTLKTKTPISATYRGCFIINENNETETIGIGHFRVVEEIHLDFKYEEVSSVDRHLSESLEHYYNAIISYRNYLDPATAIKEFK